jgi:DNA helicase HerA-like ATPase
MEIEQETHRYPFIFFEEAHLYVSRKSIDYIVTRARHLGMTSFFVTNMIHGLDETILRQADNLFLLRIPFDDDVRHVSRGAATDYETMAAFVRRLRQHHALVIGNVTAHYPLMFKVDPLAGINTAGETRYFFRSDERGD